MPLMGSVFLQGLALSLSLIVAIGAQNAFVLRQGLRREHVASVVFFCAISDALLIAAGVLGMGQALGERPMVAQALALAGAVFLAVYGWKALRRALQQNGLLANEDGDGLTWAAAMAQAAAFTLLNPHVYLDTVLLVGSIRATARSLATLVCRGCQQRQLVLVLHLGLWRTLVGPLLCPTPRLAGAGYFDWTDHVGVVGHADRAFGGCHGVLKRLHCPIAERFFE